VAHPCVRHTKDSPLPRTEARAPQQLVYEFPEFMRINTALNILFTKKRAFIPMSKRNYARVNQLFTISAVYSHDKAANKEISDYRFHHVMSRFHKRRY